MDNMPITTLRFGAKARSELVESPICTTTSPTEAAWASKQLQDLFDEAAPPLTLQERMENWGSD
jgi:hypothetical protein